MRVRGCIPCTTSGKRGPRPLAADGLAAAGTVAARGLGITAFWAIAGEVVGHASGIFASAEDKVAYGHGEGVPNHSTSVPASDPHDPSKVPNDDPQTSHGSLISPAPEVSSPNSDVTGPADVAQSATLGGAADVGRSPKLVGSADVRWSSEFAGSADVTRARGLDAQPGRGTGRRLPPPLTGDDSGHPFSGSRRCSAQPDRPGRACRSGLSPRAGRSTAHVSPAGDVERAVRAVARPWSVHGRRPRVVARSGSVLRPAPRLRPASGVVS